MPRPCSVAIRTLAVLLWTAIGCAQDRPAAGAEARQVSAAGEEQRIDPCAAGLISDADASGILATRITGRRTLPGDGQTCELSTAGGSRIEVSLRPGLGKVTVQQWLDGKMPVSSSPLAGVGERAVWQEDLHEVIAERGDVLCEISAVNPAGDEPHQSPDALRRRLGALCNGVFAALR